MQTSKSKRKSNSPDTIFPKFFEVVEAPELHPQIQQIWMELQPEFLKYPGDKKSDQQVWLLRLRDRFLAEIINLVENKEIDLRAMEPFKANKFKTALYENGKGLCYIVGYKLKPGEIYHLKIQLI